MLELETAFFFKVLYTYTVFPSIGSPLKCRNSQARIRPKPGTWSWTGVSHGGGRDLSSWLICCFPSGCDQKQAEWETQAGLHPRHPYTGCRPPKPALRYLPLFLVFWVWNGLMVVFKPVFIIVAEIFAVKMMECVLKMILSGDWFIGKTRWWAHGFIILFILVYVWNLSLMPEP